MCAQHQPRDIAELPVRSLTVRSRENRRISINELRRGDHIVWRTPFNTGKKQIYVLWHHAIVIDVQPLNEDGIQRR